ncbi:DUF2783 domain-containing protein [Anianabacter salinae]|uniref:DUF2783 domain-containing protein n=1 Tax=Anianabacter salinae TaxID=2851023 RepID=UPI00225E3315|nr:DUF2783 domain-containing protein [Anianabacter salinae]MBV0911791.1 DUF2783 domain-containing protein [Anianabacter salinae]
MSALVTTPNIPDPDGFYADLIAAQDHMTDDEASAFAARLVLILSNHIGDREVLAQAIHAAAQHVRGG